MGVGVVTVVDIIEDNPIVARVTDEVRRAGLLDPDSDYDGLVGRTVIDMAKTLAGRGHSGFSAKNCVDVLSILIGGDTLTPLTRDPAEWAAIPPEMAGAENLSQNRRNPKAMSFDGGQSYTLVDDPERKTYYSAEAPSEG